MALHRENRRYATQSTPATPPPMLRYRVHRALDERSYVEIGKSSAVALADFLRQHSIDANGGRTLDFGCGPGRVGTWFKEQFPQCALHGSDIDPEAIGWAQRNLSDVATFDVNSQSAPTDYADGEFDLVYCISLFTHLDATLQDVWLAELRRIIRPEGYLIATTHGRYTLQSCTSTELEHLQRDGIAFRVDRKGRFKLDGLPDFYQTTFHCRDYVARHWSRFFDVVTHSEGGLRGHHDLILLRRPAD